jgi:toxin ParE1/3/4
MRYKIEISIDAAEDLRSILKYIMQHDSIESADYVLDKIDKKINSLTELPERGSHVKELRQTDAQDAREIYFKPYRVIYSVNGDIVSIMAVIDGRRDLKRILQERLLR